MSTDLLLQNFTTLATAPEGIPRLRELILQLAVQGKLGTQDPGDEPARMLLERIKKERQNLVHKGIIKKEKVLDPIQPDEISYQIPDKWVLTRLGEIAQYNAEIKVSVKDVADDAWILDLEDIEKDTSRILQKLRYKARQSLSSKSRFLKGDVLYGKLRPYLNKVVVADEDGYCTTEIVPIRPYGKIFPNYLMYALKTPDFLAYVNSKTYGIKMPRLGTTDALNTIIPLPPLAEQHRIVAKVDRLMALCDELEAWQQKEWVGCLRLGTASLGVLQNATPPEEFERQWAQMCDAFDLILDCPENVAVLRQTILQLAVQGRLVRQEPSDDPAAKLLEKIRKEKERLIIDGKIRPDKKVDLIEPNEIPFGLPKGWLWVRLGSVLIKLQDGVHNSPVNFENGDFMYVTAKNIKPDGIQLSNITYISAKDHEDSYKRCDPKFGDVLLIKDGATSGIATINNLHEPFSMLSSVALLRPPKEMLNKYLLYVLRSPFFYTYLREDMSGCAITRVTLVKLNRFIIPLPPLAEQHRIVAKVDTLMALCDALESRLKERAGVQQRFAAAVGKQVADAL